MADIEIILGSESDFKNYVTASEVGILEEIGVSWRLSIISCHRNPHDLRKFCEETEGTGTQVYIAIAGMAAGLPGAIASYLKQFKTVIGVALGSKDFPSGVDALLSMVRMPSGIPVLTAGIGTAGIKNAFLAACQILALTDPKVRSKLREYLVKNYKPPSIGRLTPES